MAYRNGTYVAFHANGTNIPFDSDIKYYNLIKAWECKGDDSFTFINSHDKTSAVRDSSSAETLKRSLRERLNNSKNMLLILGETTRFDTDWVPFEISYAIDVCRIPIVVAYLGVETRITDPSQYQYSKKWPAALRERINGHTAKCIHIPFKKAPIHAAINYFNHNIYPIGGGLGWYSHDAYNSWGI